MAQDTRVCRFCLDTKETKKNSLIEPCDCKGSIQFVHEKCLLRWRRMDPMRNADICLLCMTPYLLLYPGILETIPDTATISRMLLRFPILLWLTVNYGLLIQLSFQPGMNIADLFQGYQYVFQLLYFLFFWKEWKVRNKALYWQEWSHFSTTFLILCQITCNGFIQNQYYLAIVPLNGIVGIYWHKHIHILKHLNSS
jgi:hypothetical protein